MTVYICLLRGINVGGNKRIKMADLRDLFKTLGIADAKTLLASGNVVFQSDETDPAKLVAAIEAAIQAAYGFESKIIMRTHAALQAVIEKSPFEPDEVDGSKLLVMFLRDAPAAQHIAAFNESHSTVERVVFTGDEIFIDYADGIGTSKLSNNALEGKLKVIGTGRNWNTVLKIQTLADEIART
jgi:uncharacterized protein (DUF1697 family)